MSNPLRWLPCKGCGKAWASKTEPYMLGGITGGGIRYRCYRCRGVKGGAGGPPGGMQTISSATFAGLPPVPWAEVEKFFPGWIASHFEESMPTLDRGKGALSWHASEPTQTPSLTPNSTADASSEAPSEPASPSPAPTTFPPTT